MSGERSVPWSRQRATQPLGVTVTASRRPQDGQWRGGSSGRPQPGHSVDGRPQPTQWTVGGPAPGPATATPGRADQMAALKAPTGIRRSASICRSSSGDRPRVVR